MHPADPIVAQAKQAITALFGSRLKRILLHGAHALTGGSPKDVYEFIVLLDGEFVPLDARLSAAVALRPIEIEHSAHLSCMAVPESALQHRTGFIWDILSEALDI